MLFGNFPVWASCCPLLSSAMTSGLSFSRCFFALSSSKSRRYSVMAIFDNPKDSAFLTIFSTVQVYSIPAANLCMGWIVQLVYDSFAWRTHVFPFSDPDNSTALFRVTGRSKMYPLRSVQSVPPTKPHKSPFFSWLSIGVSDWFAVLLRSR